MIALYSGGSRRRVLLYLLIPVLAVLTTWATGFWQSRILKYGFPLPWRTGGCPACFPLCQYGQAPIQIACFPTNYNWVFFVLDAALYGVIGYAIPFAYTKLVGANGSTGQVLAHAP